VRCKKNKKRKGKKKGTAEAGKLQDINIKGKQI
jgi:hypothetical protein